MYGLRGLGIFDTPENLTPGPDTLTPESVAWGEGWWAGAISDSGNVCDSTSKMFDPAICNTLYVPKGSLAQTLNANAGKIALGAGAFLALVLFAKAGR